MAAEKSGQLEKQPGQLSMIGMTEKESAQSETVLNLSSMEPSKERTQETPLAIATQNNNPRSLHAGADNLPQLRGQSGDNIRKSLRKAASLWLEKSGKANEIIQSMVEEFDAVQENTSNESMKNIHKKCVQIAKGMEDELFKYGSLD